MKRIIISLVSILIVSIPFAQSKITGKVIDEEFNETMPFANVLIKGTSMGVTTDFDGNYSLDVNPGNYNLIFSFVGYKTKEITDINIGENEVKEINVNLSSSSVGLEEVVVSVSVQKNTEEALLMMQKKSASLMDGLSSESFKKVGSSNLANAIKRAPGVSLVGGKYVYVRGLGDRYTKTILNGIDIPGLDPDRNTLQMDLFPTNILDNVQIIKSFTADVPADFTGGLVNIITKEFPSKRSPSLSLKMGYNPTMHFNENYLTYKGSNTDFLGFDNGSRDIPLNFTLNEYYDNSIDELYPNINMNPISGTTVGLEQQNNVVSSFSPNMSAIKANSLINYSIGYSSGNQFDIGKNDHTIGLLGAISYNNQSQFFENAKNGFFNRNTTSKDSFDLEIYQSQEGDIGINNVILSGLGGISYRTDYSKYKITLLHIQNGESRASYLTQLSDWEDAGTIRKRDILEYSQRSIGNLLVQGTHTSKKDASFKTEWKISPTISKIYDKDIRSNAFRYNEDNGTHSYDDNKKPTRIWRYLNENHLNSKLDFTKTYELFGEKAKFKFGGLANYQAREFNIVNFEFFTTTPSNLFEESYNGIADSVFSPNNIISGSQTQGTFLYQQRKIIEQNNRYNSEKTNLAAYFSNETKFFSVLRAIVGLRIEKFDLAYTGNNEPEDLFFFKEKVINKLDFFPSLNLIYQVNENSNLRTSLTRTTARPSFKEASIASIYDPLSDFQFNGNINIKPTYITNYDFRYEFFGEFSQVVAFSGFFKQFKDPIELVVNQAAQSNFQPQNLGSATVMGLEMEIRKNLSFIHQKLKDLSFNINASVIESRLTFGEGERILRTNMLRNGETLKDYRQLQGQAPYLINSGINYTNPDRGIQTGFFYNVQGKTLEVVGTGFFPDVYSIPFHSLNFNFNKTFGKDRNSTLNIRVNNILNDLRESTYEGYGITETYHFRLRNPGRIFSIGYKLRF